MYSIVTRGMLPVALGVFPMSLVRILSVGASILTDVRSIPKDIVTSPNDIGNTLNDIGSTPNGMASTPNDIARPPAHVGSTTPPSPPAPSPDATHTHLGRTYAKLRPQEAISTPQHCNLAWVSRASMGSMLTSGFQVDFYWPACQNGLRMGLRMDLRMSTNEHAARVHNLTRTFSNIKKQRKQCSSHS